MPPSAQLGGFMVLLPYSRLSCSPIPAPATPAAGGTDGAWQPPAGLNPGFDIDTVDD